MHPKKPFPSHSKIHFSPNTVLHSIGPAGKLKGTAFQLIEKYTQLGKEAVSDSDMALAQDCFQYAEHYKRLLHAFRHERIHPRPPYFEKAASNEEESISEETHSGTHTHTNRSHYRNPHHKNHGNPPSLKHRTHAISYPKPAFASAAFSENTYAHVSPVDETSEPSQKVTLSSHADNTSFPLENSEKKRTRRKNKTEPFSEPSL